ncbi:MAG: ABC transporter ATP-binding protein [Chloroflexi bacterium]|nr:MAG: ABC transporter ATP-binding protein [Chloroflexota bacterium]MBL1192738.1 ABC transporter ATP-binding protein [Chloroflexota bacterium]NOH10030.1 ABC transporter ATP-binding protein [Chloroflexota bacterium]
MNEVALQVKSLTKEFGSLTAVDNLSLEVYRGEIFGFLGPNGAGKTTSIRMMCGLLEPDSGEVIFQGGKLVGICPQETILWEKLTCLEQLEFIGEMYNLPAKLARQRGDELLSILGLEEKRHNLASTLSGGMKRRLNLALALIHDPEILVLDEPEAGLDPQSRLLVREYIRSLAQKKTIILTTHNMDEAERMADRVAIIDHGKLLVTDTPEALKRTIGEGDVLEIEILSIPVEQALAIIQPDFPDIQVEGNNYFIRAGGIMEKMSSLFDAIKKAGGEIGEVHLRANTLEDVFISLTGRRLRQ